VVNHTRQALLDIIVGDVKPNIERDGNHIPELASKASELNRRLEDAVPTRAGVFRDLIKRTNGRAVWYRDCSWFSF